MMTAMVGGVPEPGPMPSRARAAGWAAVVVLVIVGAATRSGAGAGTAIGAGLALVAGTALFHHRSVLVPAYAVATTAGVVLVGNADSHSIVWFALVVVAAWCVLAAGATIGLAYWIGTVLLFGSEWLWALRDPGWAPWAAGVTVSVLASLLLRQQFVLVARLRAAQAELAEQSRAEERRRIAGELHDVIAHSLTVSLLHVTAARLAVEHDPGDAARSLDEAERLGRASLTEVRSIMGLMRDDRGEAIPPPVPQLAQVSDLVAALKGAGADISLVVDGACDGVPATTGTTAYRIVQEALTNATKHAPGRAVAVRITVTEVSVELDVQSAGAPGSGSGLGVPGMAARASAVGGTCTAGPGGPGWVVQARLPTGATR